MSSVVGWPHTGRLEDHWAWRPEWTADRPRLLWYLTFEDRPEVSDFAAPSSSALARTGADVIPDRWLHLTLCDIGFADEVDAGAARDAAQRVRDVVRTLDPVRLTLGPLAAMADALVLAVGPLDLLRRLRTVVDEATFDGPIERPVDSEEFWPHISLCYVNPGTDQDAVRRVLDTTADEHLGVACDRLTQALVRRSNGHYHWEALEHVELTRA